MKLKYYTIFILLFTAFTACKKDEPKLAKLSDSNVSFVHEDGTALAIDECIKPETKYAVSITVKFEDADDIEPYKLDYTFNGVSYSMTFDKEGTQTIKITLAKGINTVKVAASNAEANLVLTAHDDFELVE